MSAIDPDPSPSPVDYRQEAGAFLAIMDEMAPQLGLDYTVESLQRLDQFISEHFEPPGVKMVSSTLSTGIGCYLGEIIIRHLGGHWRKDGTPAIEGAGPLDAIFPLEKALKRFENGKQDSLAWYYHSLLKKASEAGFSAQTPVRNASFSAVNTSLEKTESLWGLFRNLFR